MSENPIRYEKAAADVEAAKEKFRAYLRSRDYKGKLTSKREDIDHILNYHPEFRRELTRAMTEQISARREGELGAPLDKDAAELVKTDGRMLADATLERATAEAVRKHDAEVVGRATKVLASLGVLKPVYPVKIGQARAILAEIERLKGYEFVNDRLSGVVFRADTGALKKGIDVLAEHEDLVDEFAADFQGALGKTTGAERVLACEEALGKLDRRTDEVFRTLEKVSADFTRALNAMTLTVQDKSLAAYVAAHSSKVADIKAAKATSDVTVGLLGAFLLKTNVTGAFVRLGDVISSSVLLAAKEAAIKGGMEAYKTKHTATEVFDEHSKNPLLMANQLVDRQKEALEILLKSVAVTLAGGLYVTPPGTAELVLGIWDTVAQSATQVLDGYLKERIALAKKQLSIPIPADAKTGAVVEKVMDVFASAYSEIEEQIDKRLTGVVKDGAKKALETTGDFLSNPANAGALIGTGLARDEASGAFTARFDPVSLSGLVAQLIVPPITSAVMKVFPPRPAELISGATLVEIVNEIHFSQRPLAYFVTVEPTTGAAVKPFAADGRPKDLPTGVGTRAFLRTNAGATMFPDDEARICYAASVGSQRLNLEVWGYYDPRSGTWTPDRLDASVFSTNWSQYKILGSGISRVGFTGTAPETAGTWHFVVAHPATESAGGVTYVMFRPADGSPPRWGHRMDAAKGPAGPDYLLGALVEELEGTDTLDMAAVLDSLL